MSRRMRFRAPIKIGSCAIWWVPIGVCFTAAMFASLVRARPSSNATEIRVEIMDSRTHRPLKRRKVQITFSGMDGQFYHNSPIMIGHTGSDGDTVFKLDQPVPPFMAVFISFVYPCSREGPYSTRTVLADGIVTVRQATGSSKIDKWCTADSQAPRLSKQAGKVVFFVHPVNRFVRSWYDTWATM